MPKPGIKATYRNDVVGSISSFVVVLSLLPSTMNKLFSVCTASVTSKLGTRVSVLSCRSSLLSIVYSRLLLDYCSST